MLQRVVAYALLAVLGVAVLLFIADIAKLRMNSSAYHQVYGFTGTETEWSHRSERNYVVRSLLLIGFCASGIVIAARTLRSSTKPAWPFYGYFALLVGLVIFAFLSWWKSGFGH